MPKSLKTVTTVFAIAIAVLFVTGSFVRSAELVMMEQNACPWCERWHEEVGVVYNRTSEGKIAPLRVVNIHDDWPEDLAKIRIERFTPTFVLIDDNGNEVDRLRGYTGDEFFWFLLGEMLKKLSTSSESQG